VFFDVAVPVTGPVIDLSPYLAQLFLAVVTAVVAFVGNEVRKFTKANFNDKQFEVINKVATVGVQAAEQLYADFDGETKKQHALDYAEAELAARGIKVDTDQLSNIIEAAVMDQFNYPGSVTPATGDATADVVSTPEDGSQVEVTTPVDEPTDDPVDGNVGDTV
jgi:LL-H family phage holin